MRINELLLPEFDQEMKNTRKILERVPEDKFGFKPHEKSMSLVRLAGHVAEMASWVKGTLEAEVLNLESGMIPNPPESKQEMLRLFDQAVAEGHQLLAEATDEDLQKIWTMNYDGKRIFSMPRFEVISNMIIRHTIHHRAQLGVYLRLNDVELPGMYGPSADEMKFWTAPAQ